MMKDESPTVTRVAARAVGAPPTNGVPSVFAQAKKGGGVGSRRPRTFDVHAVKIESGVALPPKIGGKGGISGYALLASRMKPGEVAWLDQQHAYGLKAWFRKAGLAAEVRKVPDGRYGVWLVAASPPTATSSRTKTPAAPARKGGKR